MTLRIVALDPGGTTGWATFTLDGSTQEWDCGQLEGPHHNRLDQMLERFRTVEYHIVCESFEYRNVSRAGLVLDSVEYIGVMKRFCQERNVKYTMQTAAMGKVGNRTTAFVKKSNLQKLGLWSSGNIHAMDAYGHLLYYMINDVGLFRQELLEKGWR